MFECHTDVVTEGDASEWKYGPFEGKLVGNRIYGRGACDTKGNLAAAVKAIQAISQSGIPLSGRILIGILVDEEGMMGGVKHFILRGGQTVSMQRLSVNLWIIISVSRRREPSGPN